MSAEFSANDPSTTPPAAGLPAAGLPAVPPAPGAPGAAAGAMAGAAFAGPTAALPPENVLRGFLLALLAIPVGVLAYMIIWNLGYIASIVGLAIAFAALFLYRFGSGGRVSIKGGIIIAAITLLTLVLAFFTGEVWDYVAAIMAQTGLTAQDILGTPGFVGYFFSDMTDPSIFGAVMGDAALTFVFGILGCAGVIFNIFRGAKAEVTPTTPFPPAA